MHDDLVIGRNPLDITRLELYIWYVHNGVTMKQVNVTTLRQSLPDYLAMVAEGETLSVTLRGRVIAVIMPPPSEESSAARARLRGSLVSYAAPFEPVIAAHEWGMNRQSCSKL